MKERNGGIVYSTEHGRMCPECGMPAAKCVCRRKETLPRGDAVVRVGKETRGPKGKGATGGMEGRVHTTVAT